MSRFDSTFILKKIINLLFLSEDLILRRYLNKFYQIFYFVKLSLTFFGCKPGILRAQMRRLIPRALWDPGRLSLRVLTLLHAQGWIRTQDLG